MRERMSYPWDVLFYSMFGHRGYQPLAGDSTGFSGSGRTISLAYGTKRKGFMFTGSPCGISRNRKRTKTEGKIKGCAREQPSPYNGHVRLRRCVLCVLVRIKPQRRSMLVAR